MERSATGRNIKALRENNDLTQTEFAEKVGVTITTVSGWETRNIPPRQKMLAHIAELFGVSVDDLVSESGYLAKRSGISAATDPAQASAARGTRRCTEPRRTHRSAWRSCA